MSSLDESIDATHEHEACVDCDIDNQTDGIEFDHICPESDDLFDNTCTDDLLDNNFTMIASIMTHPIVRSTFVAIFFIGFFFVFYLAVNWILTLAAEEENEIKQKRLKSTPPPNPSTSTTSSTIPQAPDGPHCACCLKPEPPPPPNSTPSKQSPFPTCGGCKLVKYCGRQCQLEHHTLHKIECRESRRLAKN
ncbi:hypothetical protein ScalyP_jg10795 [Parmales sp. scaly parma]|nr:hypothetical protein ScalyP_jg10795 [Parmales sp. scaly parma]